MSTVTAVASGAGDGIDATPKAWVFNAEVAKTFDRHVGLSVPEYEYVQRLVARLATYYLVDDAVVVDWGCATGRTIEEVARENSHRRVRYVGVDESADMLAPARARLGERATLIHGKLLDVVLPPRTCLVLALWTVQFLPVHDRLRAYRAAGAALERGGAFILVEKVLPEDPALVAPFQEVLWEEKIDNGYEAGEIAAKARSLRGVLRPVTAESVERDLREAGFTVSRFWQHLLFVGWLCTKN